MHQEALDKKRREIFSCLNNFPGFYLAGGTALALQIGHRLSLDFDFFSQKEISKNLLTKIKKVFTDKNVVVSVNNSDELTVFVNDIKITFLKYPFPVLKKLASYQGVYLLDIKEITATKAYTIGRRGSYKDYIDLYFVFKKSHACLRDIIDLANKKYKDEFNSRLFLEQLIYLQDIEDEEIIFLKEKADKQDLESFFKQEISKFAL